MRERAIAREKLERFATQQQQQQRIATRVCALCMPPSIVVVVILIAAVTVKPSSQPASQHNLAVFLFFSITCIGKHQATQREISFDTTAMMELLVHH